ncbi:MAG: hypothetical protein SFY56_11135 [Bacteroidota bacterium]|nr:hypothetical protein [Bacteroidota bacterium]
MNKFIKYFIIMFSFMISFKSYSQDSITKIYNRVGKLSREGLLIKGNKEGVWKFYDDSLGYLFKKQFFKNDYPDGEIIEYNSFGVIKLKGHFSEKIIKHKKNFDKKTDAYFEVDQSLPVGEWLYYDDSGKLIRKETYNNKGKLLKRQIIK